MQELAEMPTSSISAAKSLCEISNWSLSNLKLQKLLYIAQMMSLGRKKGPLIEEDFEAWNFGPVEPNLYHKAKAFGAGPVKNIFHWVDEPQDREEIALLEEVYNALKDVKPGKLVAITHWENGAWARHFEPGVRGKKIPKQDIAQEYRDRMNE